MARDPAFPNRVIEARTTMDGDHFYAVTFSRNLLNLPQGSHTVEVQDSVWGKDSHDGQQAEVKMAEGQFEPGPASREGGGRVGGGSATDPPKKQQTR